MEFATNGGVRIAYDVDPAADGDDAGAAGDRRVGGAGERAAETVAFVEGLGYGRWMWRRQRAALDEYDTLVPDNRGTGESDVPEGPYTVAEMAGDLEAVLADAGVERVHLVGASMGGMIALTYALDYDRVRSLTLCCTSPGGPDAVPTPEETAERIFDVPEDLGERAAIRHKMAPALSEGFAEANPEFVEQIVDWRLASDAPERARAWQAAAVQGFDVGDRLDAVDVPALVFHGTADRVVPVENGELLADLLPDAEFAPVEGGSHLFFLEDPDPVNERLRRFLDGV